jgi:antitoxin HicB
MRKPQKANNIHIGETLDGFLKAEGIYEDVQTTAIKRALASQLEQAMKDRKLTKTEVARRMRTSRVQLDRLLDPDDDNVTLATLRRAAAVVGREVKLELVEVFQPARHTRY